ncbi:unnamed protein product [Calicophoron daubneyi]|uniref:nicotinamidase n=1 Tax=Calicophoron daubneyi TaxID=300641 RepID=A0AAV2TD56_CALDB
MVISDDVRKIADYRNEVLRSNSPDIAGFARSMPCIKNDPKSGHLRVQAPVLVIVDVQNDFIRGTLRVDQCPAKEDPVNIIGAINDLIKKPFKKIFVSQDWHPSGHISFYENREKWKLSPKSPIKNAEQAKIGDTLIFLTSKGDERTQKLWPAHCIADTPGAALYKDLNISMSSAGKAFELIRKGTIVDVESYSAFGNGELEDSGLENHLKMCGADVVFVCGIAFDVCVAETALNAASRGYRVVLIQDATAGISKDTMQNKFAEMVSSFIHVTTMGQVPKLMSGELLPLAHIARENYRQAFPRKPCKLPPELE